MEIQNTPPDALFRHCFDKAIAYTLANTLVKAHVDKIIAFLIKYSTSVSPWLIVSPSGLPQVTKEVFEDAVFRDFLFRTTTGLILRLGDYDNYEKLVMIVAKSVTVHGGDNTRIISEYEVIPKEISEQLPTIDEVINILKSNKWLVTLILITQYVSTPELMSKVGQK